MATEGSLNSSDFMITIQSINEMQVLSSNWRRAGQTIALVPTMGSLHEGHISLLKTAKEKADFTVVSLFVNPTQFAPTEDLDSYPRDFLRDQNICLANGVSVVFAPSVDEMYPPGFSTWVTEESLSRPLCGRSRPNHFRGVTTIVCKLFHIIHPDFAVFGQKDAQQVAVIKKVTRDLNFPVEILVNPIIREHDGLAMSSRNGYLTQEMRKNSLAISQGLSLCTKTYHNGERCAKTIKEIVANQVASSGGRIDYIECVNQNTLEPVDFITDSVFVAVAAYYGDTRLIDNCILPPNSL